MSYSNAFEFNIFQLAVHRDSR